MNIATKLANAGVTLLSTSMLPEISNYIAQGHPGVINIYSETCGYSQQIATPFANLQSEYREVRFYGADVDRVEGLGASLEIKTVPTFVGYACGTVVKRLEGADEEALAQLLSQVAAMKCH